MTAGVRGADSVSANSSVGSIATTIPAATVTGDRGYAFVTYNPTNQDCPTPTGWTLVGTRVISTTARDAVYKKTMTTAEASSALTFTNTLAQRLQAGVIVFDGTQYGDIDKFASAAESTATATHAMPTTAALSGTCIKLNIFSERSSSPSTSVTSPPAGTSLEASSFGTGAGATGGALAVDMTPVATGGTVGGGNLVASAANAGCAMWTLAIFKLGQTVAVGATTETDSAAVITRTKTVAVGRGAETEAAGAVVRSGHQLAVGRATETNTTGTVAHSKALPVARAVEASTGTGVTPRKARAVQGATETDTAGAVGHAKRRTVAQATETGSAAVVARRKQRTIGQVIESDSASAIVRPGQVARATETGTAGVLTRRKTRIVGQATDTSTAGSILRRKLRTIGQAVSAETAALFGKAKIKVLAATTETETARPLAKAKTRAVGRAVENGTVGDVHTPGVTITVFRATETATAASVTVRRIIPRPTGTVIPYPGGEVIPRPSGTVIPRP